jgi:dTDP-4-dehydrorhamnose reductase
MEILITGGSGQLALSYAQIDRKNFLYLASKKAFSYVPYGDKVMVKKITSADFKTIEKAPGCTPLGSIESQKIGVKLRRWSSALKDFLEHNHA